MGYFSVSPKPYVHILIGFMVVRKPSKTHYSVEHGMYLFRKPDKHKIDKHIFSKRNTTMICIDKQQKTFIANRVVWYL